MERGAAAGVDDVRALRQPPVCRDLPQPVRLGEDRPSCLTRHASVYTREAGLANGRRIPYGLFIPTIQEKTTAPAGPDYEAPDLLVVSDPEQLRALADELRTRIAALLRDRARSTQELSVELGLPKGTVGHHLKVLERAGLIHVVRTRQIRAVTEKYYGRTARLFVFRVDDDESERALASVALRQAAHELEQAPEGAHFSSVRSRLSASDARRLMRRLERLIDDFRASDVPDGVMHAFATGLWNTEARGA